MQLDQLPFTVGSPVGGTVKNKNGAVRSFQRIEGLLPAKLVASRKSRRLLPDGESNGSEHFQGRDVNCIALKCSADGYTVSLMTSRLILRVEELHLPDVIVIQRQFGAGHFLLRALC